MADNLGIGRPEEVECDLHRPPHADGPAALKRIEHRHCYTLTDDGRRFAVFYSKLGDRVLPALFTADQPNAPPKIRQALEVIDGCIDTYTRDACLVSAA